MRSMRLTALLATLLFCLPTTASANENICDVTITPVKVVDGWLYDTYDITVCFWVKRGIIPPAGTIYFEFYLVEEDPIFDDKFGPGYVCVPANAWVAAVGGWKTKITYTFKGITDCYGDDWAILGPCVCEVSCKKANPYIGISNDELPDGTFTYDYLVENDIDGIGMDPNVVFTQLIVGDLSFDMGLQVGQGQVFNHQDFRAPVAEDDNNGASGQVPYVLVCSDGSTLTGDTLGPDTFPWDYLGVGLPSQDHGMPILIGQGPLTANSLLQIDLLHAPPNALSFLTVGFGVLNAPFKGGTLIPDITAPGFLLPLQSDPLGQIPIVAPWPDGVPGGLELHLQYWIQDDSAPNGFVSTNGLRGTAQ